MKPPSLLSQVAQGVRVVSRALWHTGAIQNSRPAGVAVALRQLSQAHISPESTIEIHAANHPLKEALVDEHRRLSYREFWQETVQIADALSKRGVRPGDTVAVMLRNRAEFMIVSHAAARLGAPLVQLSFRAKPQEAEYILENAGAQVLFVEEDAAVMAKELRARLPRLRQLVILGEQDRALSYTTLRREGSPTARPPKAKRSDAQLLIYTSGTTGKPKGASRKLGISAAIPTLAFLDALGLKADDRHLAVCPLYHSAGIGFTTFTLLLGGTVFLRERFDAEDALRTIAEEEITTTMMVPTMYQRLLELPQETFSRYNIQSLRRLVSGAALLPVPLQAKIRERFGALLCDFYGSTETGWNTLAMPEDLARKPGTIGKVIEGCEIRLLGEDGRDVPLGEVGQLYVRSLMQIDGYHDNDAATQAAMRDGFFSVGDLAKRDAEGYYFLAGRKIDMVISGGVNIYPKEIEDVLHQHPAVADTAVIGIDDIEWGEALRAFVVLRSGQEATSQEALRAFCKAQLSNLKCPREFYVVSHIPRNPTGKILKRELKTWVPGSAWPWQPEGH